ncbi:MAG: hypothetical protein AMJ45_01825 [Syntrophobacter sp. DG_60]|nr:MAG: hypothetical protein AMJ45_01825 [Syntrophobacter sp. DG_60]
MENYLIALLFAFPTIVPCMRGLFKMFIYTWSYYRLINLFTIISKNFQLKLGFFFLIVPFIGSCIIAKRT